jgi:plasmid stabilization system protein ParE
VALELFVSRRAAAEIERAVIWWAENRPAAPGAVRSDLKTTLDVLLQQPLIGSRVEQASSPDVRRFHVDRISYWIYYRVRGTRFEVVSVWHSSRGNGPAV